MRLKTQNLKQGEPGDYKDNLNLNFTRGKNEKKEAKEVELQENKLRKKKKLVETNV